MDATILFTFKLGAASAVIAAFMGWLLAEQGGYNESHLFWHKWLGIGVGILSIVALFIKGEWLNLPKVLYKTLLGIIVVLLMATGHFGGVMTHGATYLTEYSPFGETKKVAEQQEFNNPDSLIVYRDIIQPMLEKRCYECHNADKANGGLQMHTTELLSKGGDGGPVLVNGKAMDSELFERITKDPISKKFMPTGGKTHLGYEEVKLIGWWINEGAAYEKSIAEMNVPKEVKTILENSYKVSLVKKSYVETASVEPLPADRMESLTTLGFTGAPLASGNNFLDIRYNKLGATPSAADIEKLLVAKEQITWLNLANQNITDAMLAKIAELPNLTRLQIQQNPITDAGIANLEKLQNLETLNLYGTQVTDAALTSIEKLPNLKKLFLWQTQVTPEGAEGLKAKLPKLVIVMGQSVTSKS